MSRINDGGQAFPRAGFSGPSGFGRPENGMTLRDWFAGQALAGLMANPGGPIQVNGMSGWAYTNCKTSDVSYEAYALADAMLKAREANDAAS